MVFFMFRSSMAACMIAVCVANPKPLRIEGLISAVFTPYESHDGGLKLSVVDSIAALQKSMGVKGVFVGGTTGDSLSLSLSERKALTEAWAPAAKAHDLQMILHVGAEALGDATELARHAEENGAVAIGAMPSVFFKPATPEAAALWLKKIGEAAPSLPLYYYHIPSMTGVVMKMLDLIKAVEKVGVPQFVGVKYTGLYENQCWMDFERCRAYRGGLYDVFCGREEMTVQALAVGARGFIGSQMNFAADVYNEIAFAWPNATRALEIQALAQNLLSAFSDVPAGVNGNRMVMDIAMGNQMGPARLPSLEPDEETRMKVSKSVDNWCVTAKETLGMVPKLCAKPVGRIEV